MGPNVLFDIGESVPKNAQFPPTIVDIDTAMRANDIAYHMNHRKNGVVLFNSMTGVMLEWASDTITGTAGRQGSGEIIVVCDNPYPDRLDHGTHRHAYKCFEPRSTVTHDDKKACRSRGGPDCTYIVNWWPPSAFGVPWRS